MKINVGNIENWILVTGAIRSGTTFVGKVLSLPLSVDYIHEPFNGGYSLPEKTPFHSRYVRPGDDAAATKRYREQLSQIFSYNFALNTTIHSGDPWFKKIAKRVVGSRGPFYLRLAKKNPLHRAAVIKDPVGWSATECLHRQFGVTPVIIVRHPVSLAASLERVGWWPGLQEIARQPDLVEDYFADEKTLLRRDWTDPMLEAAARWRLSYKMLFAQAHEHPGWQVVTHETLCQHPVAEFKRLYRVLDLPWSASVARRVRRLTGGSNSAEASKGQAMDLRRNSADIFEMRRDAISREKRRAIFDIVGEVALKAYSRESFALD